MRIAILGSVATQIPPAGQAAIESLVYYQALGLGNRGHQVSLFAPAGSTVPLANVEIIEVGSGGTLTGSGQDSVREKIMIEKIGSSYKLRLEIANLGTLLSKFIERKDDFDIVLNNLRGEAIVVPVAAYFHKPLFHVLHLPLFDELIVLFQKYETKLISLSDAQRKAYPQANYVATVYNGVDTSVFSYNGNPADYFLYLGSIGRNKNPKEAILACKTAGVPMKIGGRIKDKDYYEKEIAPLIDGKQIRWVGELTRGEIIKLYQGAKGFLFPTLWEEPFGLVLIEAGSCGTPAIAYPNGATAEIVENGKNGFLVRNVTEMTEKIKEIDQIKREDCRSHVEENFTVNKMVDAYENALKSLGV